MTLIAGRKHKSALLDAIAKAGGHLINVVYGQGSAESSYLTDMFGFVPEVDKVVITCLLSGDKADAALDMLVEKFHFDKPNTGIAFTTPVEMLSV